MDELAILTGILVEVLNADPGEIDEDTDLVRDLGADSMDLFQVMMAVEMEFDIETDSEGQEDFRTVGDILQMIRESR